MIALLDHITRAALIQFIKLYQTLLSPDHSFWAKVLRPYGYCRFHPTCSNYALEALTKHPLIPAGLFITKRLLRCHPWSSGGLDYVPASKQH